MTQNDPKKAISRRSFLKLAGASLGMAVGVTACDVLKQEEDATSQADMPLSNRDEYSNVPGPEDMPPPGVLGFFSPEEAHTVDALAATILPGTPEDPGAREAGVVFYIDGLLWHDRGFGTRTYYRAPFAMSYEGSAPPAHLNFTGVEILWVPKDLMSRFGWQSILTPREFYRMGIMAVDAYSKENHGAKFADLTEEQQEEVVAALADDKLDPIGGLDSSQFFKMLRQHTIEGMFSDPVYRGNRDMVGWKLIGYPGSQRAYTAFDIQDEKYYTKREPQSISNLHPFNPGEPSHPDAILPVTGSGTPGVPEPNIHPQP